MDTGMEWQRFIVFFAAACNLILGLFVLAKGRNKLIGILFTVFLIGVAAWGLGLFYISFFTYFERSAARVDIVGRFTYVAGSAFIPALYLMALFFPKPKNPRSAKIQLIIVGLIGLSCAITTFLGLTQTGVTENADGGFYPILSLLGKLYHIIYYFLFIAALVTLFLKRKHFKGTERKQVNYLFVAVVGFVLVDMFFNMLLISLGRSEFIWIPAVLTIPMAAFMAYAIMRHRMLHLGVVFRSSLIYSLAAAGVLLVSFGMVVLFTQALGLSLVAGALSGLALAVVLVGKFTRLSEKIVDYTIFRGHYNYRQAIISFGEGLNRIIYLDKLLSYIINRLKSNREIIVKEEDLHLKKEREYTPILSELEWLDSALIAPIFVDENLIGIISLGEKTSGDIYASEDIYLVESFAHHISTALGKSRLFNDVLVMKNHNQTILENLISGVVTTDESNKITSVNNRALEILEMQQGDVIGKDASTLGGELFEIIKATRGSQSRFSHENVFIDTKNRASVPLGVVSTILKHDQDTLGVLLVFNDMTDQRELEARMRQTDKLATLGTVAAQLAHEIKNPLGSIRSFAQMLPEKFDDPEFRELFTDITLDEIDRINNVVKELLSFARPVKPMLKVTDIGAVIEKVIKAADGRRSEKGAVIENLIEDDTIVMADKDQITQVITNLVLNAVDAVESETGRITVTGGPSQKDDTDTYTIRVGDNGSGITEENLQKLFDPFFSTKSGGFGLGLAIVKNIITEHHGTIEVESHENEGTTFTINLLTPMSAEGKMEHE